MPALNLFYKTVETALIQDGWINIKSLKLDYDGTTLEIDLSADKLLSAQKGTIYIAAEVKSFVAPSVVYAFHQAIGQYIHYRMVLLHQRKRSHSLSYSAQHHLSATLQQFIFSR